MTEKGQTQNLKWDEIDVDENVTEADLAKSEDISKKDLIGRFLCVIAECVPRENVMKAYQCVQANIKLIVEEVLELEQPLIGEDGKPITYQGEPVGKKMPVPESKKAEVQALIAGQAIYDGINMFHPLEKEGMKNRRLFVARKIGILAPGQTSLPTSAWAGVVGRRVIVETEWDKYKDAVTGDLKKKARVMWDGYASVNDISKAGIQETETFNI